MNARHDRTVAGVATAARSTTASSTGCQYFQVEIGVAVSTPSPVDVILAVLVAVADETVTTTRIGTTHNHRNLVGEVRIDGVGPLGRCESCAINELLVLRITEIVGHCIDDISFIGTGTRGGVLHLYGMTGILHQSCNGVIIVVVETIVGEFHLRPLEGSRSERAARKRISIHAVSGNRSCCFLGPLPIEHDLCHCRCHTSCVATTQIIVVRTALVPFGFDKVVDVVFRCSGNGLCRLDVIFLHVLDLLLVFLKKVFQAWRNVVGVERTFVAIAEDVVRRALIAADDDESLVESAIEYIEEGVAFRRERRRSLIGLIGQGEHLLH